MKRKTLVTTAAVAALVIGAAAFAPAFAQGPGMGMGRGGGHGMGMMGQGMGQGMMGQGMGPGMMGQGQQAYGPGNCPGFVAAQGQEVTVDSVTKFLEARLARWGNDRLKIGKVEATDDKTITGEIVTKDGSLVQKFAFDKTTGRHQPVK
ncbi:MAG: hypothetical protein A3B62_04905 [Rhodospirillales bacterium RIFCSPLOWO2_01_FULL_65_14]|nr:MAG: hypothetical protein A3B62_04905 [Rhodospirillales bacterium RIFCSPLOWO2_01_FULL_65_14]